LLGHEYSTPSIAPAMQRLDDTLVLRSVTPDDIEPLAQFNGAMHEPIVKDVTLGLLRHHPGTQLRYWLLVEDESTHTIAASLCLIPWTWRYAGVALDIGEMGIVATHPDYRHRGLIRALDRRFKELLDEEAFDLSPIEGIPYFYRQFGYEYALPLDGGWHLRLDQVPDGNAGGYTFRQAGLDDVPLLARLYDEAASDLDISADRSEAVWRFLLEHTPLTATQADTWLVLDPAQTPVGYCRVDRMGFGEALIVADVSRLDHRAAAAVLGHVKALAVERGKPFIRLVTADSNPLVALARAWGAQDAGRYAWQIHIPCVPRLLRKIGPILEHRIAASPFAELTETVTLNLYKEAFELRFEAGRLLDVDAVGFREMGEINIPPLLLAPLVLGYRSRAELRSAYPDVWVMGRAQALIDVLFPKMSAYMYTIY
jgi:predicted N-acetyltransferase YhbS